MTTGGDLMPHLFLGFVVLGLATSGIFFVWRLASRRQALPCPVWLSWLVELDNPFTRTNRAAVIIGNLGLSPGMTVLDAGCGPGRLAIPLAWEVGEAGEVVAMDLQEGMLARVGEKAKAAGLGNIRLHHAALGQGTLAPNTFDRAVLVTVLGEIPDREAAMREIHAALRPGGILSVTEVVFDPHFQPRGTVGRIAHGVGFLPRACHGHCCAYTLILVKPG